MSQAEQNFIGACLLDNSVLENHWLSAADFSTEAHREIFKAVELVASTAVADAVSVAEELERVGQADCAKLTYSILGTTASASNAEYFAKLVREDAQRRKINEVANRMLVSDDPATDIIDGALGYLSDMGVARGNRAQQAKVGAVRAFQSLSEGNKRSVSAGIADIDRKLGGLFPGDLVVIGARPAMGKTAMALNMMAGQDFPVGLISGEQDAEQIGLRNIAIQGRVSLHKMRLREMTDDDWRRANDAVVSIGSRNAMIDDTPRPTISHVRTLARRWTHRNGMKVLFVDYLQKLRGGDGESFRLQMGDVVSELKNIARELDITVVALAQVKREVETRPLGDSYLGRLPAASDIAESGIIEQEADQIMTLYRPEVYVPDAEQRGINGKAYLSVCKNRHGPTGLIDLVWRGEFVRFENQVIGF